METRDAFVWVEAAGGPNWIQSLKMHLGDASTPKPSLNQVLARLSDYLPAGKAGRAGRWLAVGLLIDQRAFLMQIRRNGLFRASKYEHRSDVIDKAIATVIESELMLELSADVRAYLQSIRALQRICPEVKNARIELTKALRARRTHALKSLLVVVDRRFLLWMPADRAAPTHEGSYYAPEEYADAFSYIARLFYRTFGVCDEELKYTDEAAIRGGLYDQLLIRACRIRKYEECELLIDVFAYTAVAEDHKIVLRPGDALLEKSIRLGYIQTDAAAIVGLFSGLPNGGDAAASIEEEVENFCVAGGTDFIQLVDTPVPRYVLALPKIPELIDRLSSANLFREDAFYLLGLAKEQYCRPDQLLQTSLDAHLTVFDVLKLQRAVNFISKLMATRLGSLLLTHDELALRSLVPVFRRQELQELLGSFVSSEAATEFMDWLQFPRGRQRNHYDLQYQPILAGEEYVMVPMNVLSSSSMARNMLYLCLSDRKAVDPNVDVSMQGLLAQCLRDRFSQVFENVKLRFEDKSLEIDIVTVIGEVLLLIECKSSFHPCTEHELRTSYDHIRTAGRQLDRLLNALGDSDIREQLSKRLGVTKKIETIRTCVATANRMFNGYRMGEHPVRQAYEMINVIKTGEVTIGRDIFRVWRQSLFNEHDLFDYLDGRTTHADMFAAMREVEVRFSFQRHELSISSFSLMG